MVDKRTLQACLTELEGKLEPMTERDVAKDVRALRHQENDQDEPPMEWLAEQRCCLVLSDFVH